MHTAVSSSVTPVLALTMAFKLIFAGVLGGIVGYEREVHDRPAGLRTHILVCLGSALMTLVSLSFYPPNGDPGRIAAQVVSGIGFLGAGTILRQGSIVRGLTTAASLWTVAGIGMAVAIGGVYFLLAVLVTIIVFLTLSVMRHFEPALAKQPVHDLYIDISDGEMHVTLGDLLRKLMELGVVVQSFKSSEPATEGKRRFKLKIVLPRTVNPEAVIRILTEQAGLDKFEWV